MSVALEPRVLDRLMPMHALLDEAGILRHAGPTLAKLVAPGTLTGRSLFEVFRIRAPQGLRAPADLAGCAGAALRLELDGPAPTRLRGVLVPREGGGHVLNLTFGISEIPGMGGHALSCTDFAPTDMTLDMLYLHEAKTATMAESRRLVSRLQGARIAAEEQAFTDTLTGLKNRRALMHVLNRLVARRAAFAVLVGDLDFFKQVNDRLGHAAGDHVLQQVAAALVQETRAADTVARVGGDEFVLLLDGLTDPHRIARISERIIARLERPIPFAAETCRISASLGIALSTAYADPDPETMLRDADAALYAAKTGGRGRHALHAPPERRGRPG